MWLITVLEIMKFLKIDHIAHSFITSVWSGRESRDFQWDLVIFI